MNCKPGDLAIRVRQNGRAYIKVGSIVEVLEFVGHSEVSVGPGNVRVVQDAWYVRYNGETCHPISGRRLGISDAHLRPIRPSDEQDETLAWAGKPQPVKETA